MFSFLYRLILFFVAISVIQSVIQAVVRAFRGQGPRNPPSAPPPQGTAAAGERSESTLLHQDPVCGTYVAAASSLRKISGGTVYHFCSEECRNRFSA